MSKYNSILARLSLPGFVSTADVEALTSTDPQVAQLVADLCIGSGSLAVPNYYIGSTATRGRSSVSPSVILTDATGFPLLSVKRCGTQRNGLQGYSVSTIRDLRLKQRGSNQETLVSTKPTYLVQQIAKFSIAIGSQWRDNPTLVEAVHAFTLGASKIQDQARVGGNYVTDINVLNEITNFVLGNIPALSANARHHADIYARETGNTIAAKQNVKQKFHDAFVGKNFFICAAFADYGIAVSEASIANASTNISLDRFVGAAHQFITTTPFRMFRSFAHMQSVAPELHSEVFLQMAMNKQAIVGDKPDTTFIANSNGFNGTDVPDYMNLMPYRDGYHENINAMVFSRRAILLNHPLIYVMERV